MCPANKAILIAGIISINPIKPSDNGSFVMRYTSHSINTNCIDQAKTINNRMAKNERNSGIRKDEKGSFLDFDATNALNIKFYKKNKLNTLC